MYARLMNLRDIFSAIDDIYGFTLNALCVILAMVTDLLCNDFLLNAF